MELTSPFSLSISFSLALFCFLSLSLVPSLLLALSLSLVLSLFLACSLSLHPSCMTTDPHGPNEFRVSGPLGNIADFHSAFMVSDGSPMRVTEVRTREKQRWRGRRGSCVFAVANKCVFAVAAHVCLQWQLMCVCRSSYVIAVAIYCIFVVAIFHNCVLCQFYTT